ncbi:malate/L-lactate dehydrogenase [Corynebacterium deserti GIMN1.010]|uniref:Malate/L-lactate dehydrogenase n=1 Tax=Corynebacterium deserti GIMN1.010 TaxID=931089 RepID=A0A0M3Q969_9CORY|nr:Ldh family oxidoreductase [Corynebacterium deserti]ALC05129.1 malate/L-lactate dehydrogenase [Corynebacterium deserti GIMN1.010]
MLIETQDTDVITDATTLIEMSTHILEAVGVPNDDAHLVADSLVQADLWGHLSHGVLRLPWYVRRLQSGAMKAVNDMRVISDLGAVLTIDGNDGIGQVLTNHARAEAVSRAKTHGIGAVAVKNSNHFGTAMYFTRRAAAQGCVSILTTNASPAMAPWGGREKKLGTNPWSIAAPFGESAAVVDMANTAVARGKIYQARQQGIEIPETWAITSEGAPTTDPSEAIDGVILPMAGHKGYAISFMMDVLSGVLTGSQHGTKVHGPYEPSPRGGAGHLFIALDVAAFRDPTDFEDALSDLVDEVKSTPKAQGFEEIFYPGELEDRAHRAHLRDGIPLPAKTWEELQGLAN